MKMITLYSFKTKERKVIPMAELAPGHVKVRMTGDGEPDEIVWIDTKELAAQPLEAMLRQPPFDNAHKEIFRELKKSLDEVYPQTLEEWELGFRCDTNPEYQIATWRWLAQTYKHFTDLNYRKRHNQTPSRAYKQDMFRLLQSWITTSDVSEVLATTLPFAELTEVEARQILEYCKVIPAEFFGGKLAKVLQLFKVVSDHGTTQWPASSWGTGKMLNNMGGTQSSFGVFDFTVLKTLDAFKDLAAPAGIVLAVDWATGDTQIVYGNESLRNLSKPTRFTVVAFAINFESEMLERLLAAVQATKGHCYYNGERHDLPAQ